MISTAHALTPHGSYTADDETEKEIIKHVFQDNRVYGALVCLLPVLKGVSFLPWSKSTKRKGFRLRGSRPQGLKLLRA